MKTYEELDGYVSTSEIATKEDLIRKIKDEATSAFDEFAKENKLPVTNPKIIVQDINAGQSYLIYLNGKAIPKQKLGTIGNCVVRAELTFNSGRKIELLEHQGKLWFNPFVWTTLNINFDLKEFGQKGSMSYFTGPQKHESTSVFYDIINKRFITNKQKLDYDAEQVQKAIDAKKLADLKKTEEEED